VKKYLLGFVFTVIFAGSLSAQWGVAGTVKPIDSNISLEILGSGNNYERIFFDTSFAGYLDSIINACQNGYFDENPPAAVEAEQLKAYIADSALNSALQLLAWADASYIKQCFPNEFTGAKAYYNMSLLAIDAQRWEDAITNANKAVQLLINLVEPAINTAVEVQYPPCIVILVPGTSPSIYR
jgi:hypothetical protein